MAIHYLIDSTIRDSYIVHLPLAIVWETLYFLLRWNTRKWYVHFQHTYVTSSISHFVHSIILSHLARAALCNNLIELIEI